MYFFKVLDGEVTAFEAIVGYCEVEAVCVEQVEELLCFGECHTG
jgi:hypothetical protein